MVFLLFDGGGRIHHGSGRLLELLNDELGVLLGKAPIRVVP